MHFTWRFIIQWSGEKELNIITSNIYSSSYDQGETICNTGTKPLGLICLKRGKVKLSKWDSNGNEKIIGLKKPGDFIELRALMTGNPCTSKTIALENCEVCIIKKKDFQKVLKNNKFAFKVIKHLSSELINKDQSFSNFKQKNMKSRLAEALLTLNNIYGSNPQTGYLNVLLKRSELAALANIDVSNAIRILSQFKANNLIEIENRSIRLINPERLNTISSNHLALQK